MELSKQSLEYLKEKNSEYIRCTEEYLINNIESKKYWYNLCDKENPDTFCFQTLNRKKDNIRYAKKELVKARKIQKEIKQAIAEWVAFERWMIAADADIAKEG